MLLPTVGKVFILFPLVEGEHNKSWNDHGSSWDSGRYSQISHFTDLSHILLNKLSILFTMDRLWQAHMVRRHLVPHNGFPYDWSLWTNSLQPIWSTWTNGPQYSVYPGGQAVEIYKYKGRIGCGPEVWGQIGSGPNASQPRHLNFYVSVIL